MRRFVPYRRILTLRGFQWLPALQVELRAASAAVDAEMLLDTGSEMTLLSRATGDCLGLKIRSGERVYVLSGISGSLPFVERRIWVRWFGGRIRVRVAWAQADGAPLLLGRLDFLDRLEICFDGRKRRLAVIKDRFDAPARPAP